jgi:hypothetical protein
VEVASHAVTSLSLGDNVTLTPAARLRSDTQPEMFLSSFVDATGRVATRPTSSFELHRPDLHHENKRVVSGIACPAGTASGTLSCGGWSSAATGSHRSDGRSGAAQHSRRVLRLHASAPPGLPDALALIIRGVFGAG